MEPLPLAQSICRIIAIPIALVGVIAIPIFLGYGLSFPSLMAIVSLLCSIVVVTLAALIWLGRWTTWGKLIPLLLVMAVLAPASLEMAKIQMARVDYAQIVANFVTDLSDQYRLVQSNTHLITRDVTEVQFFQHSQHDPTTGMELPTPFLVQQVPLFIQDHAIMAKGGTYYVDPACPVFRWDPLFLHSVRTYRHDAFTP